MGKEGNIKKRISEGAGGNVVETIQVLYCTPLSCTASLDDGFSRREPVFSHPC